MKSGWVRNPTGAMFNRKLEPLGSCRRLGINPAEYLQEVFERLPKAKTLEIKSLTPAAWLKAKHNTVRQTA